MFRNRYQALSKSERRAFWVVIAITVLLGIFAATLIDTLLGAPNLQYTFVNAIPFALLLLSIASAALIFFDQVELGAWLLLFGSLAGLLVNSTQAEGFGFPSAFILLAITLFVPLQVFKGTKAVTALWIGIAGTIGIILVDTFWTGTRVPALQQDVITAQIASVVLGAILVAAVLTQYPDLAFRSKLIVLFVTLAVISVSAVSFVLNLTTRSELTQQLGLDISKQADRVSAHINSELENQVHLLEAEAQHYVDAAAFANSLYPASQTQDQILSTILAQDKEWISGDNNTPLVSGVLHNAWSDRLRQFQAISPEQAEVFITDQYGANVAATNRTSDYYQGDEAWWQVAFNNGAGSVYIGQPEYDESSRTYAVNIAVPILLNDNQAIGVLRTTLNVNNLLALLDAEKFGNTGEVDLRLDRLKRLGIEDIPASEVLGLDTIRASYGVATYEGAQSLISQVPLTISNPNDPSQQAISKLGWQIIVHQDTSEAYAPIVKQTRTTILIALIVIILAGILGYFASQWIVSPIVNLTNTAESIADGDLNQRSNISTNDEIGTLARTFNNMTAQLQDTLSGLERRVGERTADLDMARLLSERRAQELQAISEISRAISTEQRLDILLPLITRLVSERFEFYHTGIFFIDDTHQFAYLQAANSEGGQKMLARGHRLDVGTGLVGTVAKTGKPRIALDVGSDAAFFDNPDLPKTRSEMALPLNVRGQTIGVLDIQSTKAGAFSESDANTLSILADQVAIAIENARLFDQTRQAREEAEALYSQVLRQEWSAFAKQEPRIGYRQSATGGKPLERPVYTEEIRQALESGRVVILDGKETSSQPTIAIPVQLRGQTIGVLHIKAPTRDRRWNRDEINLAQAVSDRLALALDNARLLQESQRQAAKEAKIGEVSAKIGASINMRNVLQTAVEELGRALPGSEVVIQFQSEPTRGSTSRDRQEIPDV